MSTTLAEVDVWNMAIDLLRDAPVSSTADTGSIAKWLSRNYANTRDRCLRRHQWNFAMTRASLSEDPSTPAFGWNHRYAIPSDCVRLLPVRYDGEYEGRLITYELEKGYILTDATAPLKVRYIARIEDPTSWEPAFADYVAATLASKMAHWLTGKASYAKTASDMAEQVFKEAIRMDGLEGSQEGPDQDDVIAARY
jgi:hypothetical protein